MSSVLARHNVENDLRSERAAAKNSALSNFDILPQGVLDRFTTNPLLAEGHAREFSKLPHCGNLSAWLTRPFCPQRLVVRTCSSRV